MWSWVGVETDCLFERVLVVCCVVGCLLWNSCSICLVFRVVAQIVRFRNLCCAVVVWLGCGTVCGKSAGSLF